MRMANKRRIRADASVGSVIRDFEESLALGPRYKVQIVDTETDRRVRADAKVDSIRRKGNEG